MNREGQTWCAQHLGVVFTILRSIAPCDGQSYWVHEVVFLEDGRPFSDVGTKQLLPEASSSFDALETLKRVS